MAELWAPDIVFTEADARRLVEHQFPRFSGASLKPFGEGWDNRLYLLDEEWVLRFPVRHIAAPLVANELAALPHLASLLPLAVPVPELIGRSDADYPFAWMGYRRLDGDALCRLDPLVATPSMAAELGEFLADLHAADTSAVDLPIDVLEKAALPDRFDQLADRVQRVRGTGLVEHSTLDALLERTEELARTEPWPHAACIVHGDLSAYHVLSDGSSITGVIDWGDVHRGDPALDLSLGYAWFSGGARTAFFDAYGPVDPDTAGRARFRALYYAPVLILYGRDIGDPAVELTGRRALGALD